MNEGFNPFGSSTNPNKGVVKMVDVEDYSPPKIEDSIKPKGKKIRKGKNLGNLPRGGKIIKGRSFLGW